MKFGDLEPKKEEPKKEVVELPKPSKKNPPIQHKPPKPKCHLCNKTGVNRIGDTFFCEPHGDLIAQILSISNSVDDLTKKVENLEYTASYTATASTVQPTEITITTVVPTPDELKEAILDLYGLPFSTKLNGNGKLDTSITDQDHLQFLKRLNRDSGILRLFVKLAKDLMCQKIG